MWAKMSMLYVLPQLQATIHTHQQSCIYTMAGLSQALTWCPSGVLSTVPQCNFAMKFPDLVYEFIINRYPLALYGNSRKLHHGIVFNTPYLTRTLLRRSNIFITVATNLLVPGPLCPGLLGMMDFRFFFLLHGSTKLIQSLCMFILQSTMRQHSVKKVSDYYHQKLKKCVWKKLSSKAWLSG